jgi:hypothetical protein
MTREQSAAACLFEDIPERRGKCVERLKRMLFPNAVDNKDGGGGSGVRFH